jgi:hypothetical protein
MVASSTSAIRRSLAASISHESVESDNSGIYLIILQYAPHQDGEKRAREKQGGGGLESGEKKEGEGANGRVCGRS